MKDQYGHSVPADLVVIPKITDLDEPDIAKVVNAQWYEVNNILLVSGSTINWLSEDDPQDVGITLTNDTEIYYIADALKRWNEIDGFYHA